MRITEALLRRLIRESLQSDDPSQALQSLVDADQAPRNAWKRFLMDQDAWPPTEEDLHRLRPIFARERGTSTSDIFGDRARQKKVSQLLQHLHTHALWKSLSDRDWENLWLLVQHMDAHPTAQRDLLPILRQWRGEHSDAYRYLADRISCRETGTQAYGTQLVCGPRDTGHLRSGVTTRVK
jgi:hypothetical protein